MTENKLRAQLADCLDNAAAVFGYRQVTQQMIGVYFDALQDINNDAIAWAFGEWIKTGSRFPTPANIRELAAGYVSDSIEEEQRQRSRHAREDRRAVVADPAVMIGLQRYRDAVRKVLKPLHTETDVLARQIGLCELGRGTTAQLAWIRRSGKRIDFEHYSPEFRQACAQRILWEEHEMSLLNAADFIAVARLELRQQERAA